MKTPLLLAALMTTLPITLATAAADPIADALASPSRPAADLQRDASRKPHEILGLFGIAPGMTVLEVFAGGGYYTQILDAVVGPGGTVLAHNNQAYLDYVGAQYSARFEAGSLPNTQPLLAELDELELAPGSLDAAVLVLTWHDFLFGEPEYGWPDADEHAFLDKLCRAMKPGAPLGVVDHVANPGGDPAEVGVRLHRVDPEQVKAAIGSSCFELTASSDALANPADDHLGSATNGPLQGQTDRFVMRFNRRQESTD